MSLIISLRFAMISFKDLVGMLLQEEQRIVNFNAGSGSNEQAFATNGKKTWVTRASSNKSRSQSRAKGDSISPKDAIPKEKDQIEILPQLQPLHCQVLHEPMKPKKELVEEDT